MKQLLFLLLFPCLALAQYPGNAGQKITLGEQTSADGLVYRGVANDTNVITPFSDTSAYIILDTVNSKFYHYNRTTTYWSLAGGGVSVTSFSAGSTGLTPSTATTGAVTLGGTLAVANGGTGSGTKNFVDLSTAQTVAGVKTFNANSLILKSLSATGNLTIAFKDANDNTKASFGFASGANNVFQFSTSQQAVGNIRFNIWNSNENRIIFNIDTSFKIGFGNNIVPTELIDIGGNARIRGLANAGNPVNVQVDVNGVLVRTSSIDIKEDVQSLPYGLNEVMLLQPSKFSYIDKYKYGEGYDIGFIAEDVNNVIPEAVGTGVESDVFMDSVKLIPVLTKAIQEQQALIKALEQRIINLENK